MSLLFKGLMRSSDKNITSLLCRRLEELKLGHIRFYKSRDSPPESWRQDQCLEMTLASGLGELTGLKKLAGMEEAGRDGRSWPGWTCPSWITLLVYPELEWIQDTWPKLHKITGLFGAISI
ncbi:hypothetical protein BG006_003757 [Podila minutissima]|uniref:Uncharacterized protein n=1 Tax=Podila minutissima TaxID=64525 RepID=A0A9P5SRI5_9FUNG|nr:hypothetical protein BG006_003757 [Podila minutissima]